jgi:hypothetical protein
VSCDWRQINQKNFEENEKSDVTTNIRHVGLGKGFTQIF